MKWFLPSFFPLRRTVLCFFTQYDLVLGVNISVYFLLRRESCHLLILKRGLVPVIKSGLSDSYDHWVTVNSCQNPFCELASELYIMQQ